MKSKLRESIRRQIKKILKESWANPPSLSRARYRDARIKEMEELHKEENETYEEYRRRMFQLPGRLDYTIEEGDPRYPGSFTEAYKQWLEYEKEKEKEAKEREKKEAKERYKSYEPEFEKALEELKSLPYYDEVIKELEGKTYNETLLDVLICQKHKENEKSIKRWIKQGGFMVFTDRGIMYPNERLLLYNPNAKNGFYAKIGTKSIEGNQHSSKGYFRVYATSYYVNEKPKFSTYTEPLPYDYYHSRRE